MDEEKIETDYELLIKSYKLVVKRQKEKVSELKKRIMDNQEPGEMIPPWLVCDIIKEVFGE